MDKHLILDGSPRKCGDLVIGGAYAVGTMGPGGLLKPWVWLAGVPMSGGLIRCTIPPRSQLLINPRATLDNDDLWLAEWAAEGEPRRPHLISIPTMGVADHVGASFYSAYDFALECAERGPSRRLSPQMAKQIAPYTPCPIFFTHPDIPDFETDEELRNFMLDCMTSEVEIADAMPNDGLAKSMDVFHKVPAVWRDQTFGLTRGDNTWAWHPLVTMLRLDSAEWEKGTKPNIRRSEALFGASWITSVVQVLGSQDDEVDTELAMFGVRGAVIEDETTA